MKKTVWLLSFTAMLGIINCGGGSEEAKKLLQKILQFVGIPQTIVVNICQDTNRDGRCSSDEHQTKITLSRGDGIDDLWQKISLSEDGRYFLETYNPALAIIIELQDIAKVNYDEGKFSLAFNGFATKADDNETKEISILESMVDAKALSKEVADRFRQLDNAEAQEKFYLAFLGSLENNINILRSNEFDSQVATKMALQEMGDKITLNQEQSTRINSCENNQSCVDEEIKKISEELIIDEAEIVEPTPTPTKEVLYGKWLKPSSDSCRDNGGQYNYYGEQECVADWEHAKKICNTSEDELPTMTILGEVVDDCGGDLFTEDDSDEAKLASEKNRANESYQSCYKERGFTANFYWSDTMKGSNLSKIWGLYLTTGGGYWGSNLSERFIRCVRGGE